MKSGNIIKILLAVFMAAAAVSISAYADTDDTPGITVYNTKKHGVYLTVGGRKVNYDEAEIPFVDANGRTLIPMDNLAAIFSVDAEWDKYGADIKNKNGTVLIRLNAGSSIAEINREQVNMDTVPVEKNNTLYVPVRFVAEAFGYDVDYTETDRFADIVITRKSDFAGFNQTDSITVWGNIESVFHESGGFGSTMPYEGEEPDLGGNMIKEYEVVFEDYEENEGYRDKFSVYWDTLYNKAYVKDDGVLYTVNINFPRFLDSLLESGEKSIYTIENSAWELFFKYGWSPDYKISTVDDTIPQMTELGEFSANEYYYIYNNELSKDIGLDMSKYSGKDVTVDIYYMHESMPEKFYPIETARGIVVKYNSEIIGAYISSGRHQVEDACSLSGKDFEEITGCDFNTFIRPLLNAETDIVTGKPYEIIERYFYALNNNDEKAAMNCIAKTSLFGNLTINILNSELYNQKISLPLTDKTFMEDNEKSSDNIKSVKNLIIEPFDYGNNTDTSKTYTVKFDAEYEKEGTIGNGDQYWQCYLVFESDKTGWKISGFGH